MLNVKYISGTSMVVQWLRLHTPTAGDLGSIPGEGTESHMDPTETQVRVHMPQLKTRVQLRPSAAKE